ncbi:unnamed protein product [Rotaria magnacalcarata]|uniref:Uncharacterized protein n=1 Tax=Rotaria magnacalcarata TaxID=392030 RepID=A0A816WQS8_9BILA|nr:unnamed protein product [Rotaria magnacalcarata]CAF3930516.1 unnamed protein product [Rotaria magnacalcarata]
MSRGGLLKQLHQNDKIALLDEADSCLKRNGLIPDGPISEHNNIYEIILTLYAGSATVNKSLTNSTSNLHLKKLTILVNTTEEPILRLLKKELSGDAPNPFAERSLFLFITTPLTLEQPFPPTWDFGRQPTINQVAFTASQLNNLDFYYETSARLMTIAYGNLMCKLMIKNERNDKWITARLGKSREHLHRIAVNLQLIQLTFDLIDQYKDTFGDLNHGLDDMIFQQRMKFIANNFLGRPNDQTRIRLELRLSIANSTVRLLNLLLRQYFCVFGEDNISLNTNDSQATESTENELAEKPAAVITVPPANKHHQSIPNESSIKEPARSILSYDEIAFTKTKLSHSVTMWKKRTNCHEVAIQLLLNKQLIVHCEKAAKHNVTRRAFDMWVKCVPASLDLTDITQFQVSLEEFNIIWDLYEKTLRKFQAPAGIIINDELSKLFKSQQYQLFIQFDVDSLTVTLNNVKPNQINEENGNYFDDEVLNTPTMNDSTTSFACSISVLQQSSQLNSTTAPALHSTDTPLETGVSNEISGQKQSVTSHASPSSTGIVTQFRLPRPMDLVATRTKQTAINRSRDIAKRST